jgi:hypothetical protein
MLRKKQKMQEKPRPIYRTTVELDKEAVIRGMNGLRVGEKLTRGRDVVVLDLMVCGQYNEFPITEETEEGVDALRVLILYWHTPSNQVGVLQEETSYTFLRELATIGMATS